MARRGQAWRIKEREIGEEKGEGKKEKIEKTGKERPERKESTRETHRQGRWVYSLNI